MDLYEVARNAMTVIIYAISVVFSLVVVMMFCKKAFLQERRDIGIYKSLGFTSGKLRLQFAVRFLIVALIGSVLGSVLYPACADHGVPVAGYQQLQCPVYPCFVPCSRCHHCSELLCFCLSGLW